MGPIRSLSGVTNDLISQREEMRHLIRRMRDANRRLTGSTGEAPTPIPTLQSQQANSIAANPPLLVQLTVEAEMLSQSLQDLRYEISYLEQFSETSTEGTAEGESYPSDPAYQSAKVAYRT